MTWTAGTRACLRIPRTRVTAAAGLQALSGRVVLLVRPFRHRLVDAPCWVVDPPLVTVLQAPAQGLHGEQLQAGDRRCLRAVPEAWLSGRAPAWSAADLEFIREHYGTMEAAEIAAHLGRGLAGVKAKILELGLRCRTVWTPELDELLQLLFEDTPAGEIGGLIGAPASAVRRRAKQLGLRKAPGFAAELTRRQLLARSPSTPEISEVIELMYPNTLTADIAAFVGVPTCRVHAFANKHGWKKTPEFVRATAIARTGADHPMRRFQFPKGHVPANKGRKGGPSHPNMVPTQFRKGNRPHTWKPVGSYAVNADGYLVQKVQDEGTQKDRWRPVHHLVWEAAHGEIPAGHFVVFKGRKPITDPQLLTIDTIECISQAEHARRNVWHRNLPPDVRKLMGSRIALSRAINRRTRELQDATT